MQEKELLQLIINSDPKVHQFRNQIFTGSVEKLNTLIRVLNQMLNNPIDHDKAYREINELCISGQPGIIIELNNELFPKINKKHTRKDLEQYIKFWKRQFHGSGSRIDYPNVAQTLRDITVEGDSEQFSREFSSYVKELNKNIEKMQEKRIEFFEDMDGDSFLSDSVDGDTLVDIIEMDIQEIKHIRKIVESGPISEIQAQEYLMKMKNFLTIKPKTLGKELSEDFNQQRLWARDYIDCYHQFYVNKGSLSFHRRFSGQNQRRFSTSEEEKQKMVPNDKVSQNISFKSGLEQISIQEQPLRKTYDQKRKLHPIQTATNTNTNNNTNKNNNNNNTSPKFQTAKFLPPEQAINQKIQNIPNIPNIPKQSQKEIMINQEVYPVSQSQYESNKKLNRASERPYRNSSNNNYPPFIHDTSEIGKNMPSPVRFVDDLNLSESRSRSKIFGKKKKIMEEEEPEDQNLVVVKHRATIDQIPNTKIHASNVKVYGRETYNPSIRPQENRYQRQNPQFILNQQTPINQKTNRDALSPNTAFPSRSLYGTSSSKKLSQFTQQKRKRRMVAPIQELSTIQDYVFKPYSRNFDEIGNFARFRRNCLEDNFTIYASSFLLVSCVVQRESDSRIKIEILYENQSHCSLAVESVYRIPKCFKIEKYSKVCKKFMLYDQVQHVFALQLVCFPLESCILNLKYTLEMNCDDIKHQNPTVISLPITMRNFLEYLMLGEEEWKRYWAKSRERGCFNIERHIILDGLVANDENLQLTLKEFTAIAGIQGYSIQEFGTLCRHQSFNNLKFLLRISLRVDNIISLQILADRTIDDDDQIDFLEYCIDVWSMLLSKVTDNSLM